MHVIRNGASLDLTRRGISVKGFKWEVWI